MSELETASSLDLVHRAREHDAVAFSALLQPRLAGLLRTATAVLGNDGDARDALQAALTNAWLHVGALRATDRFDAWLLRIVVNECRHALRRRGRARVREISIGVEEEPWTTPLVSSDGLADSVVGRDTFDRAFERLGADQRAILVLRYHDEMAIAEIAAVLAVPEGTVKSRLFAARSSLERALEKENR